MDDTTAPCVAVAVEFMTVDLANDESLVVPTPPPLLPLPLPPPRGNRVATVVAAMAVPVAAAVAVAVIARKEEVEVVVDVDDDAGRFSFIGEQNIAHVVGLLAVADKHNWERRLAMARMDSREEDEAFLLWLGECQE